MKGDQIYAFKPSSDRFFCFFYTKSKIIVTNGFEKKSQKVPRREKDKALRNRENYIAKIHEGIYYGKKNNNHVRSFHEGFKSRRTKKL